MSCGVTTNANLIITTCPFDYSNDTGKAASTEAWFRATVTQSGITGSGSGELEPRAFVEEGTTEIYPVSAPCDAGEIFLLNGNWYCR